MKQFRPHLNTSGPDWGSFRPKRPCKSSGARATSQIQEFCCRQLGAISTNHKRHWPSLREFNQVRRGAVAARAQAQCFPSLLLPLQPTQISTPQEYDSAAGMAQQGGAGYATPASPIRTEFWPSSAKVGLIWDRIGKHLAKMVEVFGKRQTTCCQYFSSTGAGGRRAARRAAPSAWGGGRPSRCRWP